MSCFEVLADRCADKLPILAIPMTKFVPDSTISDPLQALRLIRDDLLDCARCSLHKQGRKQIVFGAGAPTADLMFVGEGPGSDEDAQGEPFVGRAGQLLNNMIKAMGLRREDVYLTNVVKCRPPGNRTPERDECATCSLFLLRQIAVIKPKVVIALGAVAAKNLLATNAPMSELRGRLYHLKPNVCSNDPNWDGCALVVTFHPAFLLRAPRQKGEAWKDLQIAMKELGLKAPGSVVPADLPARECGEEVRNNRVGSANAAAKTGEDLIDPLPKLLSMPLVERIAAVAEDVQTETDEFRQIAPHKLAEALGVPESRRPTDRYWSFTDYAHKESLEQYAYEYGGLSDVLVLIKDEVTARRFQALVERSSDFDDLQFDFLTAEERQCLEEALAFEQLRLNMDNGISCIAHHCIPCSAGDLRFEVAIEDDGACIDLKTPYDEREGRFENLDDCVTNDMLRRKIELLRTPKESDMVCGTYHDNFILIPRTEALRLASIHDAIYSSTGSTWGEFREKLSPKDWQDVLTRLEYQTLAEYRAEEGFETDDEALDAYRSLPLGERMPIDSDKFESDWLPGLTDGDWPEWPAQEALRWVPRDIKQRFGKSVSSVINGPFLTLDPSRASEIVAAMEELGYACERDDALVAAASGG